MKKIAVLGLGRIGKIHLKNLADNGASVHPVAISSSAGGQAFADSLGIRRIYTNLEESLHSEDIDAYILCSPSDTHYRYTKLLIEAGKDIFCEKPLDLSVERITELDDLARARQVKLMVAFNRRFDPSCSKLKKAIQEGAIGQPHSIKITSRDPGLPPLDFIKHSGGLFMDMVIHDFDMLRFLLDDEVEEIYTKAAVRVDPAIEAYGDVDTAVSLLTFKSGTMAVIDNSRQAVYGYDQRIEAFGDKGMLQMQNRHPFSLDHFDKQGAHSPMPYDFFIDRYADSYRVALKAFLNALENSIDVPVSAADAREATRIALAAMKSVEEKRPVKMDEIE